MSNYRTHYDNLKVARNAPDAVIRAAYKALMQKYHPDKFEGTEQEALRIAKIIKQSFDALIDPVKRAEHDRWIDEKEAEAKHASNNKAQFEKTANAADQQYYQSTESPPNVNCKKRNNSSVKWALWIISFIVVISIFNGEDNSSKRLSGSTSQTGSLDYKKPLASADEVLTRQLSRLNQQSYLFSPSENELVEKHFAAIKAVHPDVFKIDEDPQFLKWINSQPISIRNEYTRIRNEGTASEVIKLIDNYKDYKRRSNYTKSIKSTPLITNQKPMPMYKPSRKCDFKPIMADEDYYACGLSPPR